MMTCLAAAAEPQADISASTSDVQQSAPAADSGSADAPDKSASPEASAETADAAQAPDAPATLDTLDVIISKVWRDNPEVTQAERALEASGYDLTTARVGYLPYAQVQSSLSRHSDESASTLYIILPIWDGGVTNAHVDVAKAKQRAAMAELVRTRMDLGQRTLDAYFNVVQAQDQIIQWNNYVAALKRLLATIQRRSEQGAAPQADVETAVSRLRQAEASLEASRSNLLTNRAQLVSLVNAMPGSLAWPDDSFLLNADEILKAKENVDRHPSHLAARADIDVQIGTSDVTLASLWPTFSLQYHKQLDGVVFDPTNDATLLVMQLQTGNSLQGALGYRAERQRVVALQAKMDAVDRQVSSTIDIDRTQLAALGMQLRTQFEAAQAANKLIDSFMRQFEAGRKSWLDVLNAQREANDLLVQSVALRRNYWFANAKLALDSMAWNRLGAEFITDADEGSAK